MGFFSDVLGGLGGAATGFVASGFNPLGALAGGVSGFASAAGAGQQQSFASDQAQRQMDFQREMSSTAYQRATADMKAAGINPMLAYMQGGASTPTGASGGEGQNVIGAGVSSALDSVKTMASLQQVKSTIDNIKADTDLKTHQSDVANIDAMLKSLGLVIPEGGNTWSQVGPGVMPVRGKAPLALQQLMSVIAANRANAAASNSAAAANEASARLTASKVGLSQRDTDQGTSFFGRALSWVKTFRESVLGGSAAGAAAAAGNLSGGGSGMGPIGFITP